MAGARIHRRDGFGSALGAVARYCPWTTWPLTIVLTCSWPVSQQGRRSAPISTADAQITVICLVHGAACATRNVKDFAHTGVELVDPWCASDEASGGPCGRWPIAVASCAFTSAVESKSSRSMSHAADWKRWRKRGIPLADDLLGPPHASSTMEPWMM